MIGDFRNSTTDPHTGEGTVPEPENISVVVPAYNAAETITDTLESLISQTNKNWEAVVVDDGSTDGTACIVEAHAAQDARIRLIQQQHGGESAARNAGVEHAQFDWLLFLDADDWISPVHLQRLTDEVISDPQLDAVICRSARVASDGTLVPERFLPPSGDLFPILARRAAFNVHTCIVRRSLVEEVGRFDTSLERMPDWDLWQRIARTGARFGCVNELLAFYRMRPNSISLDAYQVLKDGLSVLRRGHSPDPRVRNPHPNYVNGMPASEIQAEQFYFLSWCAGLLLGQGKDARMLLKLIHKERSVELYPDAVAQCIFDAAMLPVCRPPSGWEDLWPKIHKKIEAFLIALEKESETPHLALKAGYELKKLLLKHSATWQPVITKYETELQGLHDANRSLTKEKDDWLEIAGQRAIVVEQQTSNLTDLLASIEFSQKQSLTWQHLAEESLQIIEQKSVELESYQKNVEDKNKELATLTQHLEEVNTAHQKNVDDKNKELATLSQHLEEVNTAHQKNVEDKNKELATLTLHLNEARTALEAAVHKIQADERAIATLHQNAELKNQEMATLHRRIDRKEGDLISLQHVLDDKILALESQRKLMEESKMLIGKLEDIKTSLEADRSNLQKLADERKSRYLHLRTQFLIRAALKIGVLKKSNL